MTDASTPSSSKQDLLDLSESNGLPSKNIFSSDAMDPALIADSSNECSAPFSNKQRIRRSDESCSSSQDPSSVVQFDYSKMDWTKASDGVVTDFDRQKCGLDPFPSYLVCNTPERAETADALMAGLYPADSLASCIRGNFPMYWTFISHRRWYFFLFV